MPVRHHRNPHSQRTRDALKATKARGVVLENPNLDDVREHEVIADPTIADAVLDRLVHNAHRLDLRGDSMRKIAAQTSSLDDANKPWPKSPCRQWSPVAFIGKCGRLRSERVAAFNRFAWPQSRESARFPRKANQSAPAIGFACVHAISSLCAAASPISRVTKRNIGKERYRAEISNDRCVIGF